MRPYIICHMLSSVDGKIDGAALGTVTGEGEYEATGAQLNDDAWICGRTTMQQHFAPGWAIRLCLEHAGRTSARLCRSTRKILCHLRRYARQATVARR
jgi:hypothetical protein